MTPIPDTTVPVIKDINVGSRRGSGLHGAVFEAQFADGKPFALKLFRTQEYFDTELRAYGILSDVQQLKDRVPYFYGIVEDVCKVILAGALLPKGETCINRALYIQLTEGEKLSVDHRHAPFAPALFHFSTRTVDFVHGAGIIHDDIHDGNIIVDGEMRPWLIDFGSVKFKGDAGRGKDDFEELCSQDKYLLSTTFNHDFGELQNFRGEAEDQGLLAGHTDKLRFVELGGLETGD
ncbi:serine/threonine protein kinase [Taxawa tesnikishii (nom. ined.)]|nr:serine/threonine protein kinase [Dothideales sp. JES 119]